MYPRIYEATFDTYKNRQETNWIIHVEEYGLQDAKERIVRMFSHDHDEHMFHLKVRYVRPTEVIDYKHWFTIVNSKHYSWGNKGGK